MRNLILVSFIILSGCSNLLYYPTRQKYVDPAILKYPPEEVAYYEDPESKERLVGWYFQSPRDPKKKHPKALIVFFHGNAQNISAHFTSLYWILDYGYDFFIFDYPGYGASTGDPTPRNTVESGERAISYVRSRWSQVPLIVLGQSLGGAVSLRVVADLQDRSRICGLVVESSFDSYKKAGQLALSNFWLTWIFQPFAHVLLSDKYSPKGKISKISPTPLFLVHRKKDSVVSFQLGQRIYQEALEPKTFLELEGEGHVDNFTSVDRVPNQKQLMEFLENSVKNCVDFSGSSGN